MKKKNQNTIHQHIKKSQSHYVTKDINEKINCTKDYCLKNKKYISVLRRSITKKNIDEIPPIHILIFILNTILLPNMSKPEFEPGLIIHINLLIVVSMHPQCVLACLALI